MARKRKPVTIVDEEGYETNGMYRRGGPKRILSKKESGQLLHEFVDEVNRPAIDRIRQNRAWLTNVVSTHLDGPLDADAVLRGDVLGRLVNLSLSTGAGFYRVADDVPKVGPVADAINALEENRQLEQLLTKNDATTRTVDLIVRLSERQGLLIQRIQDQGLFAEFVMSERNRRIGAPKGARKAKLIKAASRPDFKLLVAQAMIRRPSYQAAVEQVAGETDYSERAVRMHAPNPAPQNRGRWKKVGKALSDFPR